jgi:hypothetical protein
MMAFSISEVVMDMSLLDNLSYMFTFSIIFAIPAGSIYSSAIYRVLKSDDQNQKEQAVAWVLNAMDLGSLLAAAITAWVLINYYPEIVANPPS